MRLSTKSRYGTRAIFDIAYHGRGGGVQIKDIARRQEISPRYLEQIFKRLRDSGIVVSKRGPLGGYLLTKRPDEIRVSDIIRVTEGGFEPVFCINPEKSGKSCNRITECVTRLIWQGAGEKLKDFFESVTIQDLCEMAETLGVQKDPSQSLAYHM